MAIFEFSSSNGFSSFTLNFECRGIEISEIGEENQSPFSVWLPFDLRGYTSCEERGYEINQWTNPDSFCITSFQG